MQQTLTVVCKLNIASEQASELDATLEAFAAACNYINEAVPEQITNPVRIQQMTYHTIREQFGLLANLAIRAIRRVAANRKTAKQKGKPVKHFAGSSVDYDARIFSFREKDWTVSLTLLNNRVRFPLRIGPYQRTWLQGQKPTSATLVKRQDGSYYLHIQVKIEPAETLRSETTYGVDLGRSDIAHTSEGEHFSGGHINRVRDYFAKQRASLQAKASKGTRSTRRRCRQLLERLSGRERRFQRWVNHGVSLRIVLRALVLGATICLEDLSGIRERINQQRRTRVERRRSNHWAFYQLRQFIGYKAVKFGVPVVLLNPAYTSQSCHKCLHIGVRRGKQFRCPDCGYRGDADYNAAKILALIGAALVNRPGGPSLVCHWPRLRAAESHGL